MSEEIRWAISFGVMMLVVVAHNIMLNPNFPNPKQTAAVVQVVGR